MLKVCLNGGTSRAQHPAVPVTPAELAEDAARCAAAGVAAAHFHPRDEHGRETLSAEAVAAGVRAIRAAAPGLPVGVTTGGWIMPDPAARETAVRGWTVLPDFASVNAHEEGAERIAAVLHERGVGIEAGIWTVAGATSYRTWQVPCLRVLVECMIDDPDEAVEEGWRMLAALTADRAPGAPVRSGAAATTGARPATDQRRAGAAPVPPVLLHGSGGSAWAVLAAAVERGLDTRIGLEDTTVLPDGSAAMGNLALVEAAIAMGAQ